MDDAAVAFAKLAGVLKVVQSLLADREGARGERRPMSYRPNQVQQYFESVLAQVEVLRKTMPKLFGDFPRVEPEPALRGEAYPEPLYRRAQFEALARTIEQAFEIRANSELATPEVKPAGPRVFISHGRAEDWRQVQAFIERDLQIPTLELAQEPNLGRTVLQKLEQESARCTSAVIVMTGDDRDAEGNPRARENVLHEIGYFQGKYGLSAVCLLHEEGTSIPSNIHGLVYIPFPKGTVSAAFGVLMRELISFYRR